MPRMTGAQAVISTLRAQDVDTIFGIPGVHSLPLYDVMRSTPGLRHVLARHEQGAGFMADGYARASGRIGVACTITGPGVTNIATPVANAYADSVPLLVISTSLPRESVGRPRGELHELKDQLGVMEALAGWARAVDQVAEIPDALRDAFRALRSGRPRAAYLQIPLDLLEIESDLDLPARVLPEPQRPDHDQIAAVAQMLRGADRALIVAGAGVTAAHGNDQLARLSEMLGAPVLLGSKSRDVLPTGYPLALATSGYALPPELRALAASSDVAMVIGTKLGAERTDKGRLPLPKDLAQIDIDPAEIGRQYPAKVAVVADARLALEALLQALEGQQDGRWVSRLGEVAAAREALRRATRQAYGEPIAMLDAVRAALPREGVLVADMTMLGYASAEYFPVFEPRTYIHASELCTIGCALPLALGAKVAAPERPVVALCGDGGFLLNAGELATAVQEAIGVVTVVFNDRTYAAVKQDQHDRFCDRYFATDLVAPDFADLARAFGMAGTRASDPDELRDTISASLERSDPTLIEVPLPPPQYAR